MAQLNKKYESTGALNIGGLVDCLLTTPEEFDNKYCVPTASEPIGQMAVFIKEILRNKTYQEAYDIAGFKRDSLEAVLDKMNSTWSIYLKEQQECANGAKIAVSKDDYIIAKEVYRSLTTNPYTREYFIENTGIETFKQLDLIWEYKEIKIRSILDLVRIDHNEKLIKLCDIKTTGYAVDTFEESVYKYQYWLQMGMYALALYQWVSKDRNDLMGYDVQLKWIVESTKYIGTPQIFSFKQLEQSWKGGVINNKKVKGFTELIEDFKFYTKNGWNYKREVVENNGETELILF